MLALAGLWLSLEITGLHLNEFLDIVCVIKKTISRKLLFSNRKIFLLADSLSALIRGVSTRLGPETVLLGSETGFAY